MLSALREAPNGGEQFASTRWTVITTAGKTGITSARALDALSELCRIYWRPLYLFLRRQGIGAEDAQDLTQGFFAELIRDRTYLRADREKGRFRSFLLGALKHFVADARTRDQAQKRGGGASWEPFDEQAVRQVEAQIALATRGKPEAVYEREWAAALLRQTLHRLAREFELAGKTSLYDSLKGYVALGSDDIVPYEEVSLRLRRPASTLRSDLRRMRTRYRTLLREEVSATVAEPKDVDDELRYLCQVIAAT